MPKNNNADDDTTERFEAEEAPVVAEVAAPKPYGQNIGDIVDASEARGGQYEAVGAGKMKRIA